MAINLLPGPADLADFVTLGCIFALLSLGLNLQWGYSGLFNAGVASFFAVGAYVTAILITPPAPAVPGVYPGHLGGYSWPFIPALIVSGVIAGITGLLIAIPTLRLRADYLAIATLGLGQVILLVLLNDEPLSGGSFGIYQIPRLFGDMGLSFFQVEVLIALVALAILGIALILLTYFGRSPWARVLKAIREDEDAAEVLGKDTFGFKLQAFVLGCVLMGVAGSLFTVFEAFIDPVHSLAPFNTFTVWAMLILGGSGNNVGAILGAFLFYFLQWFTVRIQIQSSGANLQGAAAWVVGELPYLRLMIVGAILIIFMIYRPQGILREKARTVRRRSA